MTSIQEANKETVRSLFEDRVNSGKLDTLADLVSREYIGPAGEKGPAGIANVLSSLRQAFPDIRYAVEELIAEGDRVAVRWHWKGTHRGPFQGFPASHRQISNAGCATFQLLDGKIVRQWQQTDRLGFLQDIGVIPSLPELVARAKAEIG